MRKFLSVLLTLVMVFNTAFSAVKADTTVNNGQSGTDTTSNVELSDVDEDYQSPLISKVRDTDGSKLSNDETKYSDSDVVRVSIVLKSPATLEKYSTENIASNKKAMSYRASLEKKQDKVVTKIEKTLGESLDVKWNLTLAANIISAEVTYGDLEAIAKLSDVEEIWIEQQYEVEDDTNTTISTSDMIYAQYAWANGYTGAGQLVAIVDTGTNQDHISFDGGALEYSLTKDGKSLSDYDLLTKEDVEAVASQLNAYKTMSDSFDVDASYKSLKIPYSFNYVDENYVTDHDSDSEGEHGSHVSGIAAANRYVKVDGEYVDALTSVYAVGVAPDAQIITMKVFGAAGGAYDSDYMAAIEDAIILGADSCNLSLGSGSQGYAFSTGYQDIMEKLTANNTVVTMSAGNSYNFTEYAENVYAGYLYADDVNFATTGTPGSFTNSLSIASANNIGSTGKPLVFNSDVTAFYTESTDYSNEAIVSVAGDYEYVYVDGTGTEEEFAAANEVVSLEGKVVICNRGSISFYVKGNNAAEYNPVAIVCANNASGTINMNLTGYTATKPFVAITLDSANSIKSTSESSQTVTVGENSSVTVYTGKVTITEKISSAATSTREEATMSDFSSWGVLGSLTMKPELTTPGGNIYSVNGTTDDEYEIMSGTSMAAPHAAGMAAVLAQYVEESGLCEKTGLSQRAIVNSLLMSTSTPMYDSDGEYYPILQQGSGLGDVFAATKSLSIVTMNEDATASYADGKVKAELGDDPDKTGVFTYSFNITNVSDSDLTYKLSTDVFTQDLAFDGKALYLAPYTAGLSTTTTYEFELDESHDVDKDGDTDTDDAQALLDYITGVVDGTELDLAAGEMDGVDGISSYDAELLLEWVKNSTTDVVVPAGETKTVKVTITLDADEKAYLDYYYESGAYIEGFTYLDCVSETEDGEILDVQKSIPVLGFYGSWTDGSMYDTTVIETYYEGQSSYSGAQSNYLAVQYPGTSGLYMVIGNPYTIEDEFPTDRLAISSETTINSFRYVLIRNAGTVGAIAYAVDEEGNAGNTLFTSSVTNRVTAEYYYVNGGSWSNTSTNYANVNKTVSELGLSEGDKFHIGVYAVPEYYAMDSMGMLDQDGFVSLVKSGTLGEGAEQGFTFTVDDTAPVIKSVELSEDKSTLTVTVSDNRYVAYVGLTDLAGSETYEAKLPEQTEPGQECTVEFNVTDIEENSVAVFVADYAANETYKVAKISDGPDRVKRYGYFLTDTLEAGGDYIIASTNKEGVAYVGGDNGGIYLETYSTTVSTKADTPYIPESEASDEFVWETEAASNGVYLYNKGTGYGLMGTSSRPYVFFASAWTYADNHLVYSTSTTSYYMNWSASNNYFVDSKTPDENGPVYLYKYGYVYEDVDITVAESVTVTPVETTLFLDTETKNSTQLFATVLPMYLDDRTVSWSTSDENIATVDANGVVTAVSEGTVTITATSNQTPSVTGTATITVLANNAMNGSLNAQVVTEEGTKFVSINLNDMSMTEIAEGNDESPLVGGGRGGNYIYGVDANNEVWSYNISNGYAASDLFTMNSSYNTLDGATFPTLVNGEAVSEFDIAAPTYSGRLGFFDMAAGSLSSFRNINAIGLCFAGYGTYYEEDDDITYNANYYYYLKQSGEIYQFVVYNHVTDSGSVSMTGTRTLVCTVTGVDFANDPYAFSMVFARGVVGGGATFNTVNGVFIADNNTQSLYYVEFPTENSEVEATHVGTLDASSLAVLYDNTYEAAKSANYKANDQMMQWASEGTAIGEAEVTSLVVEETSKTDEAGLTTVSSNVTSPKLAAIMSNKSSVEFGEDVEDSETTTVNYSQDVDSKNGLVTVTYDPNEVEFLGVETVSEFYSVNDDENGTVTFAYAQTEEIEANSTIAEFYFSKPCEDSTLTFTTKEVNDSLDENDVVELETEGVGHVWNFVGFEWNEDYTEAKAKFVCERNEKHVKYVDATVESKVTKEPTYEEKGEKVVTATAEFESETYTETKTVEIAKLVPDTGDHSNIVLWTSVTTVSLLAVVVATLLKKKYAVK